MVVLSVANATAHAAACAMYCCVLYVHMSDGRHGCKRYSDQSHSQTSPDIDSFVGHNYSATCAATHRVNRGDPMLFAWYPTQSALPVHVPDHVAECNM